METVERSQTSGLKLLEAQAEEFNFYQAIRILESIASGSADSGSKTPMDVKFKAVNTQAFTPNFLSAIDMKKVVSKGAAPKDVAEVNVNGFSMAGQQGPLPDIYAEMLQRESLAGNTGPEDFVNLFNSRFIHLLYDIKKILDPMLFNQPVEMSMLYKLMEAITGHATWNCEERIDIDISQLLSFTVTLVANRQNYSSLKHIIETIFNCDMVITPCVGAWRDLPDRYRTKLGHKSAILGSGIGLGEHYWDNQAAIDVKMKLSSLEDCRALLPQGIKHNALIALLSLLTDGRYQINVKLSLDWEQIPKSELKTPAPMHLGQSSWLKVGEDERESLNFPDFTIYPSLSEEFANSSVSNEASGGE